jgi:spore coat polysaccharide biosynthesis protein SpsF
MDLGGKPLLERVVERVRLVPSLEGICVATSSNPNNSALAALAERLGVHCYAAEAPEENVLQRYVEAATFLHAAVIVRVTADNPFTDPYSMQEMIDLFFERVADCVHNDHAAGLSSGFCSEVISAETLVRCSRQATLPAHREHVTSYIYDHSDEFRIVAWEAPPALRCRQVRLSVDTAGDLERAREIFRRLGENARAAGPKEILALFDARGMLQQ